jgi:NAD dependent epimerase/dehydratase family enzyme
MAASAASSASPRGLRVLVSGASGMVGRALVDSLSIPSATNAFRPEIFRLVRRPTTDPREVFWDPYEMRIDIKKCEGMDAVVHLAGEWDDGGAI